MFSQETFCCLSILPEQHAFKYFEVFRNSTKKEKMFDEER